MGTFTTYGHEFGVVAMVRLLTPFAIGQRVRVRAGRRRGQVGLVAGYDGVSGVVSPMSCDPRVITMDGEISRVIVEFEDSGDPEFLAPDSLVEAVE